MARGRRGAGPGPAGIVVLALAFAAAATALAQHPRWQAEARLPAEEHDGDAQPGHRQGDAQLALVEHLAAADAGVRRRAAERLLAAADPRLLAPLVDQLFFTPPLLRDEIQGVLVGLTGERNRKRYLDWVEHVGARHDLAPPAGYVGWKGRLFSRIHPRFAVLLRDGVPLRIRPEEIVSGGVPFDGIPSLERPRYVPAAAAHELDHRELVFAARVGGEARAWPLRVLSWHEMLNDRLGGEAVTLSFCTLCRSAVLYRGRLPGGGETTFGTSGLLYRSNKLMVDRATLTLWAQLTGEPVLGPRAADPRPLQTLPHVLTTWGAWRREHPDTTAMVVDPALGKRYGYEYVAGAADARRAGVSFPVPRRDSRLAAEDEIYGLRLGGVARAYPVARLLAAEVVNDTVGGEAVVLVADRASGALRAFRRGHAVFRPGGPQELLDASGGRWRIAEEALVPAAPGLSPLPRVPAQRSFWLGWHSFYPATEVFSGPG